MNDEAIKKKMNLPERVIIKVPKDAIHLFDSKVKITDEQGKFIPNIRSVNIDMQMDEVITANIEMIMTEFDIECNAEYNIIHTEAVRLLIQFKEMFKNNLDKKGRLEIPGDIVQLFINNINTAIGEDDNGK